MDTTPTLLVTRAPEDEKHGNHLRAPSIGIIDLHLKVGGKSSLFHLPKGAPKPPGARTGADEFNFLPEHDVCDLVYEIDNAFDIVDRATLEVYKRFEKDPLWTLDLVKLGPTWIRHGKHTVKWDGRIIKGDVAIPGVIDKENTTHDLTGEAVVVAAADDAPFPDGWVTLEHPPYKLRLSLESDVLPDNPAVAWTHFHVLLEKIELELGPEEAIPNDGTPPTLVLDKAVRKQLADKAGWPVGAANGEIYLLSNLFKNADTDFDPTSIKDFTTYETLWGLGPRISIVAKLTMRAADGSAVDVTTAAKGAVALGRAKFMWDVTDPPEVPKAVDTEPKAFIADAIQYYPTAVDKTRSAKNHTYFEGDNCHVDRGGGRGPDAEKLFPDQDGYAPKATLDAAAFPFAVTTKVRDPVKRKWAAFSHAWTSGKLKGHTGVLFRPARTAGDNYIISVQLAYDWAADGKFTIDVTDKALKVPAKITAKTGTLEVWRRIHLARYLHKPGVPDFLGNFNQVADYYKQAFIDFKNEVDPADNYDTTAHLVSPGGGAFDYNALCQTELGAAGFDLYDEAVIAGAAENHGSAAATFRVVPYATFVENVHVIHHGSPANDFADQAADDGVTVKDLAEGLGAGAALAAAAGVTPVIVAANARRVRINTTRAYIRNQGYWNLAAFSETLEGKLKPAAKRVAKNIQAIAGCGTSGAVAPEGLTVVHFEYLHSGNKEYVDAGNADHDGLRGSAIDAADRKLEKVVFAFWRPLVQTFAHECGHHLFLPHTKPPHSDANAAKVHDKLDKNCLMSYETTRHGFCGFCQLRLRGWKASALDPKIKKNKKP